MENYILYFLISLLALLIGSFLNVCIYRIPLGKTVVKGRSYCTSCNALIPWYCNIPLFSYLFLKGRCLRCKSKISIIYPSIELLNLILWLFAFYIFGLTLFALFIAIVFSILIVVSIIYIKKKFGL